MLLLSWLITAARDTIRQVVFVWLVASAIGLDKLHHSVVGAVEIFAGLFTDPQITVLDYGCLVSGPHWVTLGNAVGDTVYVAVVKYSHVMYGRREMPEVELEEHDSRSLD